MRVSKPVRISLIALAVTPLAFGLGLLLASVHPVMLPLLPTLALYPAYIVLVLKNRLRLTVVTVLAWALILTVLMVLATLTYGERVGAIVIKGPEYKEEMFHWMRTGKGPEGDPKLFLAPKVRELLVFSLASFATAGFAGLLMGAILLNYMNYYVGMLLLHAVPGAELLVALLSWPIYAILRVPGYVCLGVALSRLCVNLARERKLKIGEVKSLLKVAVILIALDFILKGTVANAFYRPLLRELTSV